MDNSSSVKRPEVERLKRKGNKVERRVKNALFSVFSLPFRKLCLPLRRRTKGFAR